MKLEWLEAVVTVAQFGSFSEAADLIPCAQSTVSRQIRNAEDELGVTIFSRSSNSNVVKLTPEGEMVLPEIKELIGSYSSLRVRVGEVKAKGKQIPLVLGLDSNTFSSKTKAALHYYKNEINNNKVQEIYYIGSNDVKQLDNNDGGKEQKNEAHIVDLLSAMSLIEFASRERFEGSTQFFEYQTPDESPYSLSIFQSANDVFKSRYLYPFKAFGYFWKHYKTNIYPDEKNKIKDDGNRFTVKTYYKYCFEDDLNDNFKTFKNNLEEFLIMKGSNYDYSYESWLKELNFNDFNPFLLENKYDKMINKGRNPNSFITDNPKGNIIAEYDSNAGTMKGKHKSSDRSKQSIFIEIASIACMKLAVN